MPKKLKVVVKSLYSHEIRKDVSLADLKSLKLEDAWPFIRDEIEIEIGSSQLTCIPHITEADVYNVTSLFVQNEKETNGKMFTPLGELAKNINKAKSNSEYVKWLEEGNFFDTDFKFPHESVKITLQDESIKNKVRVIMVNFSRNVVPKDKNFVNNIYLDVENNKDLKGKKSVYMITNVLMAKTIEFRVTRGTSSRIFHLGNASPLVFGLEEFLIGEGGKLIAKVFDGILVLAQNRCCADLGLIDICNQRAIIIFRCFRNTPFLETVLKSRPARIDISWCQMKRLPDLARSKLKKQRYRLLIQPVTIKSKLLHWQKVDPSDQLYIPAEKQHAASVA